MFRAIAIFLLYCCHVILLLAVDYEGPSLLSSCSTTTIPIALHITNILTINNKQSTQVPDLVPEACGDRVLVMDWVEGEKLLSAFDTDSPLTEGVGGLSFNRLQEALVSYDSPFTPNKGDKTDKTDKTEGEERGDSGYKGAGRGVQDMPAAELKELQRLSVLGIRCSLSQLLETGVLHADPHGGNLLRGVRGSAGTYV